eukprot:7043892-Pyramimonas_sp.AAC.1
MAASSPNGDTQTGVMAASSPNGDTQTGAMAASSPNGDTQTGVFSRDSRTVLPPVQVAASVLGTTVVRVRKRGGLCISKAKRIPARWRRGSRRTCRETIHRRAAVP